MSPNISTIVFCVVMASLFVTLVKSQDATVPKRRYMAVMAFNQSIADVNETAVALSISAKISPDISVVGRKNETDNTVAFYLSEASYLYAVGDVLGAINTIVKNEFTTNFPKVSQKSFLKTYTLDEEIPETPAEPDEAATSTTDENSENAMVGYILVGICFVCFIVSWWMMRGKQLEDY
eukprot:PhF_6_TR26950/c0_g1_i1/m.39298